MKPMVINLYRFRSNYNFGAVVLSEYCYQNQTNEAYICRFTDLFSIEIPKHSPHTLRYQDTLTSELLSIYENNKAFFPSSFCSNGWISIRTRNIVLVTVSLTATILTGVHICSKRIPGHIFYFLLYTVIGKRNRCVL